MHILSSQTLEAFLRGVGSFFGRLLGISPGYVYADHAATTPIRLRAALAMISAGFCHYANPGSLHTLSRNAGAKLQTYRDQVRQLISAPNHDIIFTRGGTEACNIAITHAVDTYWNAVQTKPTVLMSPIEHAAVHETCQVLHVLGRINLEILPIDEQGILILSALEEKLHESVALVIVQHTNSEIGIIQPIKKISHKIRQYRIKQSSQFPLFFSDSIQALPSEGKSFHVQSLGLDYATISGSKIGGPKSAAILCIPRGSAGKGIHHGGGQELGMRAGTEDIVQIAGFTAALQKVMSNNVQEELIRQVKSDLVVQLRALSNRINFIVDPSSTANHILHISIDGYDSEYAILHLDSKGVYAATQSACSAHDGGTSRVVKELKSVQGVPEGTITAYVRLSFGAMTRYRDVERIVEAVRSMVLSKYVSS